MPPAAVQNGEESVPNPHLIFVYGTLKRGFPNHYLMEDLIRSNDAVPLMTSSSPSSQFSYLTALPCPLVLGPLGIPYLLNLPGSGCHVRGELYSVTARALVRLDEFEGLSYGHYERLPMKVVKTVVAEKKDLKGQDEERKGQAEPQHDCNREKEEENDQNFEDEKKQEEVGECGIGNNDDKESPVANVLEAEAYYAHRSYAEDMWRRSGMVGLEEYTVADSESYVKPESRPAGESFVGRIRAYVASSD